MYRKTIRYKDFHGVDRKEVFDFNLMESEIALLEADYEGSITQMFEEMSKKDASAAVIKNLRKIILLSYGVISDDGRVFRKSEELRNSFEQMPAYSELFLELARDEVAAVKFFERVISNEIIKDD